MKKKNNFIKEKSFYKILVDPLQNTSIYARVAKKDQPTIKLRQAQDEI